MKKLHDMDAWSDTGQDLPLTLQHFVPPGEVECLQRSGVLVVRESDFGEATVSLNRGAVSFTMLTAVTAPTLAIKADSAGHVLTWSKLQIINAMTMAGWEVGKPIGAYAERLRRMFFLDLRKPASYFAALLRADSIFAKFRLTPH